MVINKDNKLYYEVDAPKGTSDEDLFMYDSIPA